MAGFNNSKKWFFGINCPVVNLPFTKLNMRFFCCSLGLLVHIIVYGQLSADFSSSATSGCAPVTINFTDKSSGNPTEWYWDFGDGTSSTLQNPSVVYTTKGMYTVRLIVKNAAEKTYIEKENYINISTSPDAKFSLSENAGCAPLQVSFTNTTNLFGEPIKSWLWDFGDGTTSNQPNPAHTYNVRGAYPVTLTANTAAGCTNTITVKDAVIAGNKPAGVSFKASPLNGCASVLRNFTDLSTGTINSWHWIFGDGGTSNQKNPQYHYIDTGYFAVKLVAGDNGCTDSAMFNKYIHVTGPVAQIFHSLNCATPYTISFNDRNSTAKTLWDFGDNTTSTSSMQLHTFATTGIYTTKLTVSDGTCFDTSHYTTYIVDQNPSYKIIPSKTSYCRADSLEFTATNYDSAATRLFAWSFDGGITRTSYSADAFSINTYPQAGTYPSPVLYVLNQENCLDTISTQPLNIAGANANFTSSSPACLNGAITFSDKSTLFKNSPVKQWVWNYGDGDSVIANNSPVNYTYPFPGSYNVLLKITDADGCTDTISHKIKIADTPTIDAGKNELVCAGKPVALNPTGGVNYTWNNSAYLSCTNCTNPFATPPDNSVFYVTGRNAAGCTAEDSVVISVQKQQIVTVTPLNDSICAGESVQLSASGADVYTWQPAASLNNFNIANPIATPVANTVYTVDGMDKAGCFSNSASVIIVASPKPEITIADSLITIAPGATYQINVTNSADVIKWQWQPPQGLSNISIPNPVAKPLQTTKYMVIGENAGGCISVASITITVLCTNSILFIPNTFSPNNDGMNDYFYPRSENAVHVKTFRIFNRWGQEIFEKSDFFTNDQSSGWNGKFKGNVQQADAYVYFLQIECSNGGVFTKQGSISLIK